jgi:hypothetical protein
MEAKLNGITVWPGIIGSDRSAEIMGWLIGTSYGKAYRALTGDSVDNSPSHSWIIVEHDGQLWIGESVNPKSKRTPLTEYERRLAAGEIRNLQLFEVLNISRMRQGMAADWWTDNILNEAYDWPAYFRLTLKAIFGDIFPWAAGLTWAAWCTEGVKDAYAKGACYDVYENENPTPLTTIKRWKEGRLKLLEAQNV